MMFNFGRNWKNYVRNVVNEQVVEEAKKSLLKYLPDNSDGSDFFKNKVFIDVGCGSGLFSLAAVLLGAKEVISFDVLEESLEATDLLKKKFASILPKNLNWNIFQGNILDDALVSDLALRGDIVYSWGVLHHTGNMWKAIENTCKLVKKDGYLIIAIYNHAPSSPSWLKIKKFYNEKRILQPFLNILYGCFVCMGYVLKNRTLNLYRARGMHVFYDAIDWIGGYPYEYACHEEIEAFVNKNGFNLVKLTTSLPCGKDVAIQTNVKGLIQLLRAANTGCNEFVFKKIS